MPCRIIHNSMSFKMRSLDDLSFSSTVTGGTCGCLHYTKMNNLLGLSNQQIEWKTNTKLIIYYLQINYNFTWHSPQHLRHSQIHKHTQNLTAKDYISTRYTTYNTSANYYNIYHFNNFLICVANTSHQYFNTYQHCNDGGFVCFM